MEVLAPLLVIALLLLVVWFVGQPLRRGEQERFELGRWNLEALVLDELLEAVDDRDEALRADGADVNRWMVSQGMAIDWPKYSRGKYAGDQAQARSAKRGLWAGRFEWPCVVRGAKCE